MVPNQISVLLVINNSSTSAQFGMAAPLLLLWGRFVLAEQYSFLNWRFCLFWILYHLSVIELLLVILLSVLITSWSILRILYHLPVIELLLLILLSVLITSWSILRILYHLPVIELLLLILLSVLITSWSILKKILQMLCNLC